jgi:hypothetical protein
MKYIPLFSVDLKHDYYADGECPNFSLTPSADTARLLANLRLVVKAKPCGSNVLIAVDDQQQPFIPLASDATFIFNLRLQDADFPFVTDLSGLLNNAVPEFTNTDSINSGGVTKLTQTFVEGRRDPGVFAHVAIHFPALSQVAEPTSFEIRFAALQAHWLYYFVTDLPKNSGNFRINDTQQSFTFADANRRDLKPAPDLLDPVANALLQQYSELTLLRFASSQTIPLRRAPRKGIQLLSGDTPIVEHLPAPSQRNRIHIPDIIAEDNPVGDSLYHIVKYISYPSLTKV